MNKLSALPQKLSNQLTSLPSFLIPYGCQWIDEEDIRAVEQVLRSESLTQGPKISEFETALCKLTGARYAVVVNSGTSALHIACLSASVDSSSEVITSCNTFVASANCVVYCGGKPVFGDIDPRTFTIDPNEIEEKITAKTRAIIPVHFAGQSCEMESIRRVVQKSEKKYGHKIFIIEDAAHAIGSLYKGKKVGSCHYSDMTIFSFHAVKHITMGEGGAVLTNDEGLYKKLKCLRSHGITNDITELQYPDSARDITSGQELLSNTWYYEQQCLGFNYRITDIQCALGLSQLRKLSNFIKRRREIVEKYNKAFCSVENIEIPYERPDCFSNFHLYVLRFDFARLGTSRARFMKELRGRNILTQVHYIPVPMQPYYQSRFQTAVANYPQALHYYERCLSIPLFPKISEKEIDWVIYSILELLGKRK